MQFETPKDSLHDGHPQTKVPNHTGYWITEKMLEENWEIFDPHKPVGLEDNLSEIIRQEVRKIKDREE